MVMCSVWKISDTLGKHYTGYPLERGRPRITWIETIMKDISRMNTTWDGICETAMERQEWRLWNAQCASHWKQYDRKSGTKRRVVPLQGHNTNLIENPKLGTPT